MGLVQKCDLFHPFGVGINIGGIHGGGISPWLYGIGWGPFYSGASSPFVGVGTLGAAVYCPTGTK
eukprot:6545136-Ditylum_brightwellii.AAC.1